MAKKRNYVNNIDLLEELYISIDNEELTRTALDMLMVLAQRTQRKLYYSCEDDKQHCLSEAYLDIVKRWNKFKPVHMRMFRFEMIKSGDEIKFYKNLKDRTTLTKCTVIEDAELFIKSHATGEKYYINLDSLNIDITNTKEGASSELLPSQKRKMKLLVDAINEAITDDYIDLRSRVKVKYTEGDKVIIKYIKKEHTVVRDPNPFSYFTSICINGYAKGYKELRPKKDKGRFISLDAGFNSENGTDLYNA